MGKKNNLVLSERNNYASSESLQDAVVAKPDQLNSLYKLGPYILYRHCSMKETIYFVKITIFTYSETER